MQLFMPSIFFLLTTLNIGISLYFTIKKPKSLLFLSISFPLYFLSVTITNMFFMYGYLPKIYGWIFYILYQLNMFYLVLSNLYANDKFINWYHKKFGEVFKNVK